MDTNKKTIKINKKNDCLDCKAKSLASSLEEWDVSSKSTISSLQKMKEALLFILWNIDWPVGD